MQQLSLFLAPDNLSDRTNAVRSDAGCFSHERVCDETARIKLEQQYAEIIRETAKFSRKTVSFQSNKVQMLHHWIHYREGFSSELVALLMHEFGVTKASTLLDPFAGSCTTLLQAMLHDYHAVGIELLPHCHLAWDAKSEAFQYDIEELKWVKARLSAEIPPVTAHVFPHISITHSAFPDQVERDIVDYAYWLDGLEMSGRSKTLLRALLMSILESVSYTRKDGQYLRWDARAEKIIKRNQKRVAQGKKPFNGIDKGVLPSVKDALIRKLNSVLLDLQRLPVQQTQSEQDQQLLRGNTLFLLPTMADDSIDAVITSPPYANRYDYTRTYALELAFLGINDDIFSLRQGLLSCTVENKPKTANLSAHYYAINQAERYRQTMQLIETCEVLQEVKNALQVRNARGEINNKGVLSMIDQYFVELTFVFMELFRVCKPGAHVAFVNDNVRYAGEVIPVDTISTHLAQCIGFEPETIYVIPQRKGNSSQQMKRFGRRALRKSITVWRKPMTGIV